jgi:hypothetical protein
MVKFNKFHVTDGTTKCRIWYSLDNRNDGRKCVTMYQKDYGYSLGRIKGLDGLYKNESDSQFDYFEKGQIVLFEDHPLYQQARKTAEAMLAR